MSMVYRRLCPNVVPEHFGLVSRTFCSNALGRLFHNLVVLPDSLQFKKLTIYNELGQKVLESKSEKATVTALSTGIYTVAVETSAGVFHKKVIKK